jgi:hypothetical protein
MKIILKILQEILIPFKNLFYGHHGATDYVSNAGT